MIKKIDFTPAGQMAQEYKATLTTEQNEFDRIMIQAGWKPQADLFGSINFWQHRDTGRIVNHTKAFDYWQMSKQTPVPF